MDLKRGHGQHEIRVVKRTEILSKLASVEGLECELNRTKAFHIISIRALIIYLASATGSSLINIYVQIIYSIIEKYLNNEQK